MAESTGNNNIISMLPLELQVKIFSMLPTPDKGRCAVVCKDWRHTLSMPDMWRGATFTLPDDTPESQYPALSEVITSRDIRNVNVFNHVPFVDDVVLGMPNLRCLCLDSSQGSKRDLEHSIDVPIEMITSNLKNLMALEMNGYLFTDRTLALIASNLGRLVHLKLEGCGSITDLGVAHLTGHGGVVVRNRPQLNYLELTGCQQLTEWSLARLNAGQPSLDFLCLVQVAYPGCCDIMLMPDHLDFLSSQMPSHELEFYTCSMRPEKTFLHKAIFIR